jgi:hypothetical protein
MESTRRWRFVAIAAIVVCVVLGGQLAMAVTDGVAGKEITAVKVRRGSDATSTTSTTPVNLPGAVVTINVPASRRALLLVRFSAESECITTGTSQRWCNLKILVDGSEFAQPESDFAFDSASNGVEDDGSWEAHSIDRSIVVGSGTHTVQVQYRTTSADTTFRLDDWHLTVERSRMV